MFPSNSGFKMSQGADVLVNFWCGQLYGGLSSQICGGVVAGSHLVRDETQPRRIQNLDPAYRVALPSNYTVVFYGGQIVEIEATTKSTLVGDNAITCIWCFSVSLAVNKTYHIAPCQGYVPLTLDVMRVAFKVPLAFHTPL